jgi:hypothetical protein
LIDINSANAVISASGRPIVRLDAMRTSVLTRQRVARWMIGVLLLAQWLTSAYACPNGAPPAWPSPGEAAVAAVVMADCHGMTMAMMDPANPALCKAHCEADQRAPVVKAQGDAPQPMIAGFIVASPVPREVLAAPMQERGNLLGGEPPGWPPLYLIHQVLRN